MKTIALFGECMIELQGELFGAMHQTFGGDTLNTAVYLARCGAPQGLRVEYATGLGTDPYSEGMLKAWADEGVGTRLVRRIAERVPGLYSIQVDASGERTFTYWRDQSAARAYFDADSTPLEEAAATLDALHVSGISLAILSGGARERLFGVMRTVRGLGGRVSFDNNYRPRLWPDAETARQAFREALALSDTALLTFDDEQTLYGDADVRQTLTRTPCDEIIVKRGAEPVLVCAPHRVLAEVPVPPVARVVDTTAAGDSFAGAFLAARLSGADPVEAAQAGSRLASTVIQHRGAIIAREHMPAA